MTDDLAISPAEMRIIVEGTSEGLVHILAAVPKAKLEELARLLDEELEDS